MDHASPPQYQYVHPEQIGTTLKRIESHGTQLIFTCPLCGQTASFSTRERVGRCFSCHGIIKLHTTYDDLPVEHLFPPSRSSIRRQLRSPREPHGWQLSHAH